VVVVVGGIVGTMHALFALRSGTTVILWMPKISPPSSRS